jgi:chaperonin GroES
MTPIRTQILFKPLPPDEVTEGGLYVPETARKVNNKGTIVKVGGGTANKPMLLKPGQKGIRVQDWGTEVILENELHFLMDMDAILTLEN